MKELELYREKTFDDIKHIDEQINSLVNDHFTRVGKIVKITKK